MKKPNFFLNLFLFVQILSYFAIYDNIAVAQEGKVLIQVPKVHIVQDGENLWHLSKENFNTPFNWRSIWKNNSFVVNPNLIFPGDQLIFPGQFMEKEVLLVETERSVEPEKPVEPEKKSELSELAPPAVELVPLPPPDPEPIKFISDSLYHNSGFIISEEKWAGKIESGPEERTIFGDRDRLFVTLLEKGVSVGDKFKIVEKLKEVVHPSTREKVGFLIQESATLEITEVRDENSTGVISESYSDVEVGDLLIPYEEDSSNFLRDLTVEREDKVIEEGYIIHGKESQGVFGRGSIVYIDKGDENGIKVGDRFLAFREGKDISGKEKKGSLDAKNILPDTLLGKIEVFNVRKKTSTALVIESKKEIFVGTKIKFVKN